jgi:hypothetical protein
VLCVTLYIFLHVCDFVVVVDSFLFFRFLVSYAEEADVCVCCMCMWLFMCVMCVHMRAYLSVVSNYIYFSCTKLFEKVK